MPLNYVITFIGDDQTGIVGALSAVIEKHGGNWLESQLSKLGGKFAGLILVALPDQVVEELHAELKTLRGGEWSVRITPTEAVGVVPELANLTLSILGPDRPGIVKEVSRALAEAGINVLELESRVENAAFTGEAMFRAEIRAQAPDNQPIRAIENQLDAIAEAMTLDIDIS
jgi:glycine cleavage system regulatory protein